MTDKKNTVEQQILNPLNFYTSILCEQYLVENRLTPLPKGKKYARILGELQ